MHDPDKALTPQWLSARLQQPIASASWRRIGTERGFAGTVLRVTLVKPDGARSNVVAKLGPDTSLDAEIRMYGRFAAGLSAPAPRCLYAGNSLFGDPILLLEDVAATRMGDALAGGTPDDVAAVLSAMSPFWRRTASEVGGRDLRVWGSPPAERQAHFRRNWAAQRDALAAELPDDIRQLGEQLCTSLAAVVADLREAPAHLVHADLHLDNVLFVGARPVVLDWGSGCLGSPSIDVFAFIAGALEPVDQQRHFADLVAGVGLDRAAVDHGRRRLLCSLAGVVGWRNRTPSDVEREQELRTAAFADGRLISALRLWEVGALLA